MTILKPKPAEKDEKALVLPPEVVTTEPLIVKEKVTPPRHAVPVAIISVNQRRRTRTFVNCCIFLNALILATAAIMGGFYLYKRMMPKPYSGTCGVQYNYDAEESSEMNYLQNKLMGRQELNGGKKERRIGHFEEQFEVDTDNGVFEKIDVPEFLDCRRATVLHDFERNTTAVIDKDAARCFIMPLDRAMVKPPKDFWDLIVKLRTGYYLPDEQVVRQKFYVKLPPVQDLSPYGFYIFKQCRFYDTYQLVPSSTVNQGRNRRASCDLSNLHYSFTGATGSDKLGIADIVGCA